MSLMDQARLASTSGADDSTDPPSSGKTIHSTPEQPWVYSSTRYSDQPMDWRTRLFGMGGVGTIIALIAAGSLITWTTYQALTPPPTLNVFDVAPPASPPEPGTEMPDGPEQVEQQQQKKKAEEQPDIKPPEIQVPSQSTVAMEKPKERTEESQAQNDAPAVPQTTTPRSQQAPPDSRLANDAKVTWEGLVMAALNKVKRYPGPAKFARQQGVPWISFVIDANGRVVSSRLSRSSGIRSLDDEAASLPGRAQPFPKPPEHMLKNGRVELSVPVEFFLTQA